MRSVCPFVSIHDTRPSCLMAQSFVHMNMLNLCGTNCAKIFHGSGLCIFQIMLSYTLLYPLKKCSLLHTERVSVWFSTVSSVKVWIFKCSPPLWRFTAFICWFSDGFPVWRLTLSTLHKCSPPVWMLCCPCEHFEIKAFTLESTEYQKETGIMWMGEYIFREIKYV